MDAMDLQEALMTTRAIRRFTDEPVTDDQIAACLRAAVQAPSGGNIQPYQFLVVTEPALKEAADSIRRETGAEVLDSIVKQRAPQTV